MDRKQKIAAAIAAVNAFISAEREEAFAASSVQTAPAWSVAGRLAQSQLANMVQVKVRR